MKWGITAAAANAEKGQKLMLRQNAKCLSSLPRSLARPTVAPPFRPSASVLNPDTISPLQQKEAAAAPPSGKKKPGRCKFCRSKAKYVPGQRSFDASRFFRGGGGGGGAVAEDGRRQPRRAASEDRRSDGMTTEGMLFWEGGRREVYPNHFVR